MPACDVAILGPHLNNDIVMAEALTYNGFNCVVLRDANTGRPDPTIFPTGLKYFSLDQVRVCRSSLEFFRACMGARCIVTYSGFLTSVLRYFWFVARILPFPPIINVPSGSDITELALQRSRAAWLYRDLLRRAAFTVIPTYPYAIKALKQLKLPRFVFIKYPYFLPDALEPAEVGGGGGEKIVYLHVSNLDWGAVDNKPGRNSTKGNDRFIRAFAAAVRAGAPIKCIMLDRGPDRLAARKIIAELGVESAFEWVNSVLPHELRKLVSTADIVVDQFDVGGLGAIAMETMSLAKPLMIHLDQDCLPLIYDKAPPVLNCSTEAEIHDVILSHLDRAALHALGLRAEKWVRKNHGTEHAMEEFLLRLCLVAGIPHPPRRFSALTDNV